MKRAVMPPKISPAFAAALLDLGPGSVAIDCGANVGVYTALMARTGARVFAFEPDPVAYRELVRRTGRWPSVYPINAAVSTTTSSARLFFHAARAEDPLAKSQSSTLMPAKANVDPGSYVDVQAVDFAGFVLALRQPVQLLKMDIEGHEIEVLNDLLDRGAAERIDLAFVELHDRKNPGLAVPTAKLRERIHIARWPVDLTWH
ncbi:MAG: FkbM family methyltransferase [Caulobacteraceae bacterium]